MDWPETVGVVQKEGPADRFGAWYISRLLDAMGNDPALRLAFLEVNQRVKLAARLFMPAIIFRVFRHALARR